MRRLALAYQRTLERIGIDATIRTVDSTQFQLRRKTFDFDMVRNTWPSSLSPGNEQINRWSSKVADAEGSFNYPGAKEPAIDAMIQAMLSARDAGGFRRRGSRLRSRADLGLLHGAALLPARPVDRPLDAHRASGERRRSPAIRCRRGGPNRRVEAAPDCSSSWRHDSTIRSPSMSSPMSSCPWCYLGKRRLERAIELVPEIDVSVRWRPYRLDPTIPPEGMDRKDYVIRKFGSLEALDEAHRTSDRAGRALRASTITSSGSRDRPTPSTRIAWCAGPRPAAQEDAMVERLFAAYFSEGLDIGDDRGSRRRCRRRRP